MKMNEGRKMMKTNAGKLKREKLKRAKREKLRKRRENLKKARDKNRKKSAKSKSAEADQIFATKLKILPEKSGKFWALPQAQNLRFWPATSP